MMRQLDLCRCCLAVGCDKDISQEYEEDGRKEVYSDMLLDTFNIFISYEDVGGTCQICEDCIARLRDAAAFKAQVIEAGKAITQKLKHPKIESDDEEGMLAEDHIKTEMCEVELSYEDFDFTKFTADNNDIDDNEDEIYIIKLEDGSCVAGAGDEISAIADNLRQNTNLTTSFLEPKPFASSKRKATPKPKKLKTPKTEITQKHLDMRSNSLNLVRNSNMVLFKAGRAKLTCYYCYQSYPDMAQLREHSKIHSHTKELVIKINPVSHLSYKKADISDLKCARCLEPCDSIEALQEHLSLIHDFSFSEDGHLLIPFKLDKGYICAICNVSCNTFAFLSMHMNSHFPNYVCETCGAAYINFKNLDVHRRVIHLRKCKKCNDKCTCKEVKSHRQNSRMCLECNITFKYSYLYKEHNYQVHGAKRPIATCDICSKTFLTPNNLKLHIRRIHNAERNHVCKTCDMSFFTAHGMRKHIRRTHTEIEIKPYSCNLCACKFKMKYSLAKHLKNRHGRRMDGRWFKDDQITLEDIQAQ